MSAGQQAPGTETGVQFAHVDWNSQTDLNSAGDVAFRAVLDGPGVIPSNSVGIWRGKAGALSLVVRSGDHAPGMPNDVNFGNIWSLSLNSHGDVSFLAYLVGPGANDTNNSSLWTDAFGSLRLVARAGDPAPGTETGVLFGDMSEFPSLSTAGQTLFFNNLQGAGVNSSNDRSLWVANKTGALELIVREGASLEVLPGDFRVVEEFRLIEDDLRNATNTSGQVAFAAWFTDGTNGIFVSNVAAIPEPAAPALIGVALLLVGSQYCCRHR